MEIEGEWDMSVFFLKTSQFYLLSICICLLCFLAPSRAYAQNNESSLRLEYDSDTWAEVYVPFSSNHIPRGMQINDAGDVCILADHIFSSSSSICYAEYNGVQWDYEVLSGEDNVWSFDLALTSDNRPIVAAYDVDTRALELYQRQSNLVWTVETITVFPLGQSVSHASLALDSLDYPHIALHLLNADEMHYYSYNGVSWTVKSDFGDCEDPEIALDNQDHPFISYNIGNSVWISYYQLGQWWSQLVRTYGFNIELLIDDDNFPHISSLANLSHSWDAGPGWCTAQVDDAAVSDADMAMDSDGNLYMAYFESTNYDLRFAFGSDSTWTSEVIDWEGKTGYFPNIALDNEGNRYIAYTRNYSDLHLLIYQDWLSIESEYSSDVQNSLLNLAISPCPANSEFTATYSYPNVCDASLEIYDISGRLLRIIPLTQTGCSAVSVESLPAGVYSVVLRVENQKVSRNITVID